VDSDIRIGATYRGLVETSSFRGNGYDVATLRVREALPENARLAIATQEEIDSLAPGMPLGTAGYPVERIANAWALAKAATPELHVGVVTSVTDMFGLPAPNAHRQLVHNDLPITGGQSGSPIIGASGRVVAVVNSMNIVPGPEGRIPNAALVNFGQRADLVRYDRGNSRAQGCRGT